LYKLLVVSFLIAGLGGCTSAPTPIKVAANGEYIGWHCEGDISSDEHWRCDKKTLKDGQVVTTATAVEPVPESVPVLEPEPLAASVTESEPSTRAVSVDSLPVINTVEAEPLSSATEQSGFTIQLGAFDRPEQAQNVAANLDAQGDIQIRQIISNGRTFSVILMGQYPSRAEANKVTETLGINYWVRSLRSLADATVQ
jgi:septal ring-binding cell division protein DamX